MEIIIAIILAVVQGLTEFLPVSSSGHLVILQQFMHLDVPLFFDALLHAGTLVAVLVYFWNDLLQIAIELLNFNTKSKKFQEGMWIGMASIPIIIVGLLFYDQVTKLFSSIHAVAIALFVTGVLLVLTKRSKQKGRLTFGKSLIIGVAQAIAVIPGISRSGSTIAAGIFQGVNSAEAARFSFLLSLPAITGAFLLTLYHGFRDATIQSVDLSYAIGFICSAVVGYIALALLFSIVRKGKLHYFGYYCMCLSAGILVLIVL